MKILSFAIFDSTNDWQFLFYIRGIFLNCCMAKIVYPDFTVYITAERSVYLKYSEFFQALSKEYGVIIDVRDEETLCRMMIWRMIPIFDTDNTYVFPRDADALVTYRESQAVKHFIDSGKVMHGLHDNRAHTRPLMGGMCGFRCGAIRDHFKHYSSMISGYEKPIDERGADQDFLNDVVFEQLGESAVLDWDIPKERKNSLWLSDLCIAFIGAAGCNEFETLRYLRDNGIDLTLNGVGKQYPNIFYWL